LAAAVAVAAVVVVCGHLQLQVLSPLSPLSLSLSVVAVIVGGGGDVVADGDGGGRCCWGGSTWLCDVVVVCHRRHPW